MECSYRNTLQQRQLVRQRLDFLQDLVPAAQAD
jgi:hypothetical protein